MLHQFAQCAESTKNRFVGYLHFVNKNSEIIHIFSFILSPHNAVERFHHLLVKSVFLEFGEVYSKMYNKHRFNNIDGKSELSRFYFYTLRKRHRVHTIHSKIFCLCSVFTSPPSTSSLNQNIHQVPNYHQFNRSNSISSSDTTSPVKSFNNVSFSFSKL